MTTRAILLAAIAMALPVAGCDQGSPTGIETIQLAVVTGAEHGGAPYRIPMTQEVTHTPVWAGDPDGTGLALITLNLGQREVCWEISVEDIRLPATAAHIHRAPAGVRGGIVVGLSAPAANGIATGCRSNVDRDLIRDMLQNPEQFYVNVHTSEFPAGAVRGQFGR